MRFEGQMHTNSKLSIIYAYGTQRYAFIFAGQLAVSRI